MADFVDELLNQIAGRGGIKPPREVVEKWLVKKGVRTREELNAQAVNTAREEIKKVLARMGRKDV
ncbi:MAG TPA: hypothetical protein VJ464_15925 [Blastocatellia bacterium]|nr:hypothetical protein [Blastocatellia bacterium]